MKKTDFLNLSKEEILKLASSKNIFNQKLDGDNMLTVLLSKFDSSFLFEVIKYNPEILKEKDADGCPLVERLADKGYFSILESFAKYIDLSKTSYDGSKNMLGYLIGKEANNAVSKALEYNPLVINIKDPAGAPGVERIADKGYFSILEKFAEHIDLTKNSYDGSKNMLGYMMSKGANNAVSKALEYNPSAINVKDPCGATGTERIADKGYFSILEKFAEHIDLTKTSYDGNKNMLGYLIGKEANNAVSKALEYNPSAINVKDPAGATGAERIADKGYFSIIKDNINNIDWSKNTYDGESTLKYILKKSSVSDGIEYIRAAAHNYPETVNKELDFIINKDLVKSLQYKEVSSIINKNRKINGINILTVLSNKGLDKYIEILLGNNSYVEEVKNKETIIEKPKQKTDDSISLDINSVLDDVKKSKSLILDRIKNIKENNELQPEDNNKGNLKSQFKSML